MKPSKYNYYIPYKGKEIVFNGITKRFFFLSEKNHRRLVSILNDPHPVSGDARFMAFFNRMKKEGFLVEESDTEEESVRKMLERERCPGQYMLMILPTYKCNLRCWYCIQEHQDIDLPEATFKRIKKHIRKYLRENSITQFRLSWFGGEPLLAYERLVDLTAFAQKECERDGVRFFCDVTTNSLLLDSDKIKRLGALGVKRFQITIDGCREKHNAVKKRMNGSAFDDAVRHVADIAQSTSDVECVLRVNYSDVTLEPEKIIHDISEIIPSEYRKKIKITPCKIWQVKESGTTEEKARKLNMLARERNYGVETSGQRMCYVDYAHFNCVFPNGLVGKCENDSMEEAKGHLTAKGDVVWEGSYPYETSTVFSEGSECAACRHLPFCMGPCPQKRDQMIKSHGKIVCQFPNPDEAMTNRILRYCENNS